MNLLKAFWVCLVATSSVGKLQVLLQGAIKKVQHLHFSSSCCCCMAFRQGTHAAIGASVGIDTPESWPVFSPNCQMQLEACVDQQ